MVLQRLVRGKYLFGGLTIGVLLATFALYAFTSDYLRVLTAHIEAECPVETACKPCNEPLGGVFVVPECGLPPTTPLEAR